MLRSTPDEIDRGEHAARRQQGGGVGHPQQPDEQRQQRRGREGNDPEDSEGSAKRSRGEEQVHAARLAAVSRGELRGVEHSGADALQDRDGDEQVRCAGDHEAGAERQAGGRRGENLLEAAAMNAA